MGAVISRGGHLCIDLTHIEMSGDEHRHLLHAVEATVVAHLARISANCKVVTISMSANNGQRPLPELPSKPPPPPKP